MIAAVSVFKLEKLCWCTNQPSSKPRVLT